MRNQRLFPRCGARHREGMYAHGLSRGAPEVFFKAPPATAWGPARHWDSGPDPTSGARTRARDRARPRSQRSRSVTLSNDVSAWDIERAKNALYLTQRRSTTGVCAIGPVIVTTDEIFRPLQIADDLHRHQGGEDALSRRGQHRQAPSPPGNPGSIPHAPHNVPPAP